MNDCKVGDRVTHTLFGTGTVYAYRREASAFGDVIEIIFDLHGKRELLMEFAKSKLTNEGTRP